MIRQATITVLSSDTWFTEALTRMNRAGYIVGTDGVTFTCFTTYNASKVTQSKGFFLIYLDQNSDSSIHFHTDHTVVLAHSIYKDTVLSVDYTAPGNYRCSVAFLSGDNCKLQEKCRRRATASKKKWLSTLTVTFNIL